ncbi:MAG TPA: TlpA disulfide reductase family protein [Pseudomonadota bacterium]|nr:TlpA disulfide reductase family protein [Pseudomonadota bacterium]HNN95050.1 TlpA disulfide reductase family protein [Pseudomonadota bacterium]
MRTALLLVLLSLIGLPAPAFANDPQADLAELLKNCNQVDHLISLLPSWSEVEAQRWQPSPGGAAPWSQRAKLPVPDKTAKLTVLHVWATWCRPCLTEFAELGRIFGDPVLATAKLVVVVESGSNIDMSKVQEAIKSWPSLGGKVPLFLDATNGITKLLGAQTGFGVPSYPTTLLLDSCGVIRHAFVGSIEGRSGVFESAVRRLLEVPPACPPAKKPGK